MSEERNKFQAELIKYTIERRDIIEAKLAVLYSKRGREPVENEIITLEGHWREIAEFQKWANTPCQHFQVHLDEHRTCVCGVKTNPDGNGYQK